MSEGIMFMALCAIFLTIGVAIKLVGPKETLGERRSRFLRKLNK